MFFKRRAKAKKRNLGIGKIDGLSAVKKSKQQGFSVYEIDPFIELSQKESFFYGFLDFVSETLPNSIVRFFSKPVFDKKHPFVGRKKNKHSAFVQVAFTVFLFVLAASLSTLSVKAAFGGYLEPPDILSDPSIAANSGEVTISWETSREATSYVYYGTNSEDLNLHKESLALTKNHKINIDGLMPSTTYFYRVQSYDMERKYDIADSLSSIFFFKTDESSIIHNVTTNNITADSVTINWETVIGTKSELQYGETADYGLSAIDDQFINEHTYKVTGLKPGTIYHFRVSAFNDKEENFLSSDYEVYTASLPTILDVDIKADPDDSSSSIIVNWKTNIPTDSYVSYENEKRIKVELDDDLTAEHSIQLYDLQSDAEYAITISGKDQFGNIVTSQVYSKKTEINAAAPKITDVLVQSTSLGLGEESIAQIVVMWKTDTPSTSQIQYSLVDSDVMDKVAGADDEYTTNHIVLISSLELSQVYKLRPVSRDENDNITYGEERIVVTEDYQPSVLEIISNMINRVFGD